MTPLKLHPSLLFYGLDGGTWGPSPTSGGEADWLSISPSNKGRTTFGTNGSSHDARALALATSGNGEPWSTDEGSEPKGASEPDSLSQPESSEGYFASAGAGALATQQPQLPTEMADGSCGLYVQDDGTAAFVQYAAVAGGMGMAGGFAPGFPTGCGGQLAPILSCGYVAGDGSSYTATLPMEAGAAFTCGGMQVMATEPPTGGIAVPAGLDQTMGHAVARLGQDGVPSIGSYAHLSGQCSRCCFHPKGRCTNGYNCEFCHFDHGKRPRHGKKGGTPKGQATTRTE